MEKLIEQLKEKVSTHSNNTRESRARKGAYVDCLCLVREYNSEYVERIASLEKQVMSCEKEVERLRVLVGKAMEWVSISTLFFDEETNSWDDLFIKGTPCTTPELVELFLKENKQP